MKNLLTALFVLVALALGWWAGSRQRPPAPVATEHEEHEEHAEGVVELTPEQIKAAGIEVRSIAMKPAQSTFMATGALSADPDREVHVSAQIGGRILSVQVREGQAVRAGQALLTLDSPELARARADYQRALVETKLAEKELDRRTRLARVGDETRRQMEEARVDVVKAESALASAEAREDVARRKLERTEELLEDGIASLQQAEEARGALREAAADVRRSKSELIAARSHYDRERTIQKQGLVANREVAEAQASAERARADARHARDVVLAMGASPEGSGASVTLTAPRAGIVTDREVTSGEAVEEGAHLMTLLDPGTLWLSIAVPESQAADLRAAHSAELKVDGQSYRGRIAYVAPSLDPETRSLKARVELANASGHLRPNMFAEVTVLGPPTGQAPDIPEQAVQSVEGQDVVYVETEPGHFTRTALGDVRAGDRVVAQGAFTVKSEDQRESMGEGHHH